MLPHDALEDVQTLELVVAVLAESDVQDHAVRQVLVDGVQRGPHHLVGGAVLVLANDRRTPTFVFQAATHRAHDCGRGFVVNDEYVA